MDFESVYATYKEKVSSIMSKQEDVNLINELQKFLEINSKVLHDKKESDRGFMTLFMLLGTLILGFIFINAKKEEMIYFFIFLGIMAVLFLLIFTIHSITKPSIHSSILFLKSIIQEGWRFEFRNSEKLWIKYSSKYPYLDSGDISNSIDLCVNGKYNEHEFRFFEYDYTIEVEEEVEYTDDDGEVYFETEYYEESYTQTCVAIYVKNRLPLVEIDTRNGANALKFSYIDMNRRLAIYTNTPQTVYRFFNPDTQKLIVEVYKNFPYAQIHINQERIFINFKSDLFAYGRSVDFDENLYKELDNNILVLHIKKVLNALMPFCKRIKNFSSKRTNDIV